jgi:hypothetical protein
MNQDPPLQWIFHFECFHYMAKVYVKEFCGYCIQTGQSFLYHVKTPQSVILSLHPIHVSTFAIQSAKHGFTLEDGEINEQEFKEKVTSKVSEDCTILVMCRIVEDYLRKVLNYKEVDNLRRMTSSLKSAGKHCAKKHGHCAQERVFAIAAFLRPATVPYFYYSVVQQVRTQITDKYHDHYLQPPYYETIKPVDLVRAAINEEEGAVANVEDCEHGVEGGRPEADLS